MKLLHQTVDTGYLKIPNGLEPVIHLPNARFFHESMRIRFDIRISVSPERKTSACVAMVPGTKTHARTGRNVRPTLSPSIPIPSRSVRRLWRQCRLHIAARTPDDSAAGLRVDAPPCQWPRQSLLSAYG